MNKAKKSLFNAATALVQMAAISLIGLVLTRTIMTAFGSDYNGINSTVNQIVNAIMVLEGGFTLASNVALFSPFSDGDIETVNGILSATNRVFNRVGLLALSIGLVFAFIFPFMITSAMPKLEISLLMITVLVPACFNLGIVMKYRVLILTDQREYMISIITTVTYIAGCTLSIYAMKNGCSLLLARVIISVLYVIGYFAIIGYCKHLYPQFNGKGDPLFDRIKGTKSVLVMKLTSMFYMSAPIIVISTLPETGTMIASVYAVYRAVLTVVGSSLASLTNAPRLGFGALFAENRLKDAFKFFLQYEKITCIALSAVLGTTGLLLMPFVEVYTSGITDIDYMDNILAVIMLLTVFFETLHIPSGQMIQMKGDFVASRKIQSIACIVLVGIMIIGRLFFGIYGIVIAVLVAAVIIAIMEIIYTGKVIFNRSIAGFVRNTFPCAIICITTMFIGLRGIIHCSSYFDFFIKGLVGFILISVITVLVYYLTDQKGMKELIVKVFHTIKR